MMKYKNEAISYENGKYTAKLPWKQDHPELPSNITVAKSRTENIVRRLSKEPTMLQKYTEIIEDQERRGFIEKVTDEDEKKGIIVHYITH